MHEQKEIEMFVLTGEQSGARRVLDDNATFTISGKMDTDVVFRDPTINEERLNLITRNNEVFVQVMSGNVEIQGKIVSSGNLVKIPEYAKIKIGETTFSYGRHVGAAWHEIVEYVSNIELASSAKSKHFNIITSRQLVFLLSLLVIISLVTILVYININKNSENVAIISQIDVLKSDLEDNGIYSLDVSRTESGQLTITGFLMTNKEKSTVESIVDDHKLSVLLDVFTGDNLAKEVEELYRVNGVDADVKVLKYGSVIVTTEYKDKSLLEKLKHIALSEISHLNELDTEYIGTINRAENIESSNSFDKDEKRITMVVSGLPAYIMTHDQSKYYIGAILPSGHKIIAIQDKKVTIEKNGNTTTLEF